MEVEEEKEKFLLEIRAQELAAQAEKEKVQEESASALVFPLRIMYSSCFPYALYFFDQTSTNLSTVYHLTKFEKRLSRFKDVG